MKMLAPAATAAKTDIKQRQEIAGRGVSPTRLNLSREVHRTRESSFVVPSTRGVL
jgi:hypothetical protein